MGIPKCFYSYSHFIWTKTHKHCVDNNTLDLIGNMVLKLMSYGTIIWMTLYPLTFGFAPVFEYYGQISCVSRRNWSPTHLSHQLSSVHFCFTGRHINQHPHDRGGTEGDHPRKQQDQTDKRMFPHRLKLYNIKSSTLIMTTATFSRSKMHLFAWDTKHCLKTYPSVICLHSLKKWDDQCFILYLAILGI